eukprot:g3617.t1
MPSGLKQPIGQKRLTNIAVVRLRKAGSVFEVACYKNKVSNWRAEIETDLDEVLQTTAIFSNVSKGIMAKEADLQRAFHTIDEQQICIEILSKGELQVSEKERKLEYDNLYKDVASILAEKCVDPKTNRQYTATIIERALKDVHFNPDLKKSAKQQAFSEALPLLQERFSIQRANMRVQLNCLMKHRESIERMVHESGLLLESSSINESTNSVLLVCLIEPGKYRQLHKKLEELSHGTGRLELLNLAVASEDKTASTQLTFQDPSTTATSQVTSLDSDLPRSLESNKKVKEVGNVVYPRGAISGLPEDFGRKEMFLEIEKFQSGWEVELKEQQHGSEIINATFFAPSGELIGAFSKARRLAIAASKSQDTQY